MKIAYKANTIIEAHIVAGMLQSFGLECYVSGHYLQGAVGDLSPMGFANVFVSDDDVEAAVDIMRDYENADKMLEAPFDATIEQKPA